jgi:hypothetical protein
MRKSHIPNFFEFTAYGDLPQFQTDSAAVLTWVDIPHPQT